MQNCKPICRPGPLSYSEYYIMKYHCRQNLPPCKPPSWYSNCPKPCPLPDPCPCNTEYSQSCPQPCPQPCTQPCPQPCPEPCIQPCPTELCSCDSFTNNHKKDIMA